MRLVTTIRKSLPYQSLHTFIVRRAIAVGLHSSLRPSGHYDEIIHANGIEHLVQEPGNRNAVWGTTQRNHHILINIPFRHPFPTFWIHPHCTYPVSWVHLGRPLWQWATGKCRISNRCPTMSNQVKANKILKLTALQYTNHVFVGGSTPARIY